MFAPHTGNDVNPQYPCNCLNENLCSIRKWLKFVPKGYIDSESLFVQVMTKRRIGLQAIVWTHDADATYG